MTKERSIQTPPEVQAQSAATNCNSNVTTQASRECNEDSVNVKKDNSSVQSNFVDDATFHLRYDDKVEDIGKEVNFDEEVLMETKDAQQYIKGDECWNMLEKSTLRIYRHKTSNKHRLVLRNVILNVAIVKGMGGSFGWY